MKRNVNLKDKKWFIILGFSFVFIAIISLLLFLLKGKVTVAGEHLSEEINTTIKCEATNIKYAFFNTYYFSNSRLQINIILQGNKIGSISLSYIEEYNNSDDAGIALSAGHAKMNDSFGAVFGADAFNANYAIIGNQAKLILYANGKDLNSVAAQEYFLIDEDLNGAKNLEDNYEKLGFECTTKGE